MLVVAQICFASLPVAGRLAMANIPAGTIPLVRCAGAAIVFLLVASHARTLRIARQDIPLLLLSALLGIVLNQELYIHGLARSTATNAVVLGSMTIPVFTLLVAIVMRRERAKPRRIVGMAVAFGGVAMLVGAEDVSTSSDHVVGSFMLLANSLAYGTYLVVVKPLAAKYDPIALVAWMFLAAVPMTAPIGVHAFATSGVPTTDDLWFFAFLVAVPTIGAYGLVQIGLRRAESTLVSVYMYLQPLFAVFGAVFLLDEHVGLRTIACGVIVLFGVWLAARREPGSSAGR